MNTEQQAVNTVIIYIVKRFINNPADRIDVKQLICLCLYKSYPHYKETGHILAWARTIAEHICIDYIHDSQKRIRRQKELADYATELDSTEIDSMLIKKEIFYRFIHELKKRIVQDKETLVLIAYFVDYKSKLCISKELRMSRKVVARIIEEAKQRLRNEFNAIYDGTYQCVSQIAEFKN